MTKSTSPAANAGLPAIDRRSLVCGLGTAAIAGVPALAGNVPVRSGDPVFQALAVLEQLQGIEAPAVEWEAQILPARVAGYDARWLDELCLSGEVVWGRLTPRAERAGRPGTPSPATPLAFVVREDLPWMLRAVRAGGDRQAVHERIRQHSWAVAQAMRDGGAQNDLFARLAGDPGVPVSIDDCPVFCSM